MIVRASSLLLSFGLLALAGTVPTTGWAQVPGPYQWLTDATNVAITLQGVMGAQAMSHGGSHFILMRSSRSCSEADALWDELISQTSAVRIGGPLCWVIEVPDSPPDSSKSLLNFWLRNVDPLDLPRVAEIARGIPGWLEAEVWIGSDTVLAVHRAAGKACGTTLINNQLQQLRDKLAEEGIDVDIDLCTRSCYGIMFGPVYKETPVGTLKKLHIHLHQVAKVPG